MDTRFLTFGLMAARIGNGVQPHHLDRLARRGLIPHQIAGRFRLIDVNDLDTVREVCRTRGYYRPAAEHANAS